jgi:hypothetical protein
MVQVTEQAASALLDLLADSAAPPDAGVRIAPNDGTGLPGAGE